MKRLPAVSAVVAFVMMLSIPLSGAGVEPIKPWAAGPHWASAVGGCS
jgi:hypothetical protein